MKLRPLRRALLDADHALRGLISALHEDAHHADAHRPEPDDTSQVDHLNDVIFILGQIRRHVNAGLNELPHMEKHAMDNGVNTTFWQTPDQVAYQICPLTDGRYVLRKLHGQNLPDNPDFISEVATFVSAGAAESFATWLDRMGGFEDEDAERPEEPTLETVGVYDSIEASKGKKGTDDQED